MEKLSEFQKSGDYLFHGSRNPDIELLEPRQAMSFGKPDGLPAVFASDRIEPPIFMAVLGSRKLGGWGRKNLPGFGFYIAEPDLARAKDEDWQGYVYVLAKDGFVKEGEGGWEWRSMESVCPVDVVKVGIKDLPSPIDTMTREEYLSITRG